VNLSNNPINTNQDIQGKYMLIIFNVYIRVLARISKVAVQNNFVGVVTNFCGRGHMFLGVAAIFCCCGIVVFYSLNLFTQFSFRCTFKSFHHKACKLLFKENIPLGRPWLSIKI
jgi:hypothetical protein